MNKKIVYMLVIGLVVFGVGFSFGKRSLKSATINTVDSNVDVDNDKREISGKWKYINPLLDCGEIENISSRDIISLEDQLLKYIDVQKTKGVDTISVYFRDLGNGPWIGINENEQFYPASLLKVPLMVAVYHQAMNDPSILKKSFTYNEKNSRNTGEYFKAKEELQMGKSYTVDEMVASMIKNSDNNASHMLSEVVKLDDLTNIYVDLGVGVPDKPGYVISVKNYAAFFRILYNSTYLSQEYSEKALGLLSQSSFPQGLVAGFSSPITVSHKFGERDVGGGKKQLHDCGVIYYPNRPYILCVMTRGSNFNQLASIIADISRTVYTTVDNENKH